MLTKANAKAIFVLTLTASLVLIAMTEMQESEGLSSSYEGKQTDFTWSYNNGSREVDFNAIGSDITNYTWNFGDGEKGYGKEAKHIYSEDKNYTITLTMRKGDEDIIISRYLNLLDGGKPTVDFYWEPETPTTQDIVHFWDNSSDPDGDIYNWTWDFGDGGISYEKNPTHRYVDNGRYDVTLFVKDYSSGGNGVTKQIIVFNVPPIADFYWTKEYDSIKFLDYSYDLDGSIVNWTWDFGDGIISHDQNPSHNYSHYGTYNVILTIKDDDSATGIITKKINTLNQIPYVNFFWSPLEPTILDTVQFSDISSDIDELINWTWDFGDGNTSYEQNPAHQYSEKRTYNVTLTVIDAGYALASHSKDIKVVNAPPIANFSWEPQYPTDGEIINFTDNSSDLDGNIVNWTWDFGDGNTSYERNASHAFSQSGTYRVNLTVIDDDGASSSKVCDITIANIYVDDDAPIKWYDERHVRTIQEGINKASYGYHIYVLDGNYRENAVINKIVMLRGDNATIDGMGAGNAITITSDNTEIKNFVITNASNSVGIDADGDNATIENCLFTDNKIGVYLRGDYINVSNNEMRGNGKGIIVDGSDNTIKNNEIENPSGIVLNGNGNEISSNTFTDNIFAIEIQNGERNKINENGFYINQYAIDVRTYGTCLITNNELVGNGNGIRLFSRNTFVNNNTLKFNTIAILIEGDENEVANCNITQNGNGTKIVSSHNILVHGCSFFSNTYGVYIDNSDLINISNNKFDLQDTDGIYTQNSSQVELFNCSFSGNTGGMNVKNSSGIEIKSCNYTGENYGINITDSQVSIENCIIWENDAGLSVCGDNITLKTSDIYENDFGLKIYGKNGTLYECNIHDNIYGIYAANSANLEMQTSIFRNEHAVYLCNVSASILKNSSLSNNNYGLYLENSYCNNITNCTFAHNEKGVTLANSSNNRAGNNTLQNNTIGLEIANSKYNTISKNEIEENHIGLLLSYSPHNIFTDNIFNINDYNIDMEGGKSEHFYEDIDVSNEINGMVIHYLIGQSDKAVNGGVGYLALINCVNMTVYRVTTESNGEGMLIVNSSNCAIVESNFSNNIDGMVLILSHGGNIKNSTISGNANDGIIFKSSSDISITNCDIFSNEQRGINAYSIGPKNGRFIIEDSRIYLNWLGINVENVHTNTIENTTFSDNEKSGIRLFGSDNNSISNNKIYSNGCGINAINSISINISGNAIWKNNEGIYLSDSHMVKMYENMFNDSNTGLLNKGSDADINNCRFYNNINGAVGDKSSFNLVNCSFTNNTYGICSFSSDSIIDRCEFAINEYGIFLYQSNHTSIINCTGKGIYNNTYGIFANSSLSIEIQNCSIFGNAYGLFAESSSNSSMDRCLIYNNTNGIVIVNASQSNMIKKSLIHHNLHGLDIKSDNNDVSNCSFWKNVYGVSIEKGMNNRIYHNNFAYNVENALDKGSNNSWDNGYLSGGNYWSDYAGIDKYTGVSQNISGSDGIGDIPYKISGGKNMDNYPLMDMCEDASAIPNSPPTAFFLYYPTCPFSGDKIIFIDCSTDPNGEVDIKSWYWDFGDGNTSNKRNPNYAYSHSGIYNVSLVVEDMSGEKDECNVSIEVFNNPPAANFTYSPQNPTTQDRIQFTDLSKDSDGSIVNWTWNFGDGTSSRERNPEHKYNDNGIYIVSLTVTDNSGAETETTKKITIANTPPTAAFFFIPEKASGGEKINFTDVSSDDRGITEWHWDFGDGTASNKRNPEHTYKESGKYTITLTVKDGDGGESEITKVIEISPKSTPGFEVVIPFVSVLLAMVLTKKRRNAKV
ncbi:MAG: PKD domain-containing protein [Candidatus Thermoplasmatota archaeon]|nr:PKD domain-containing protein [Candidatus Thermoplasmatota archaeon]